LPRPKKCWREPPRERQPTRRPFPGIIRNETLPLPDRTDDASFCHKVTAGLNKGWHLFGSPTYGFDAELKTMKCGQAVVKDVDGVDYDAGIRLSDY
jgi:hypothetical protein